MKSLGFRVWGSGFRMFFFEMGSGLRFHNSYRSFSGSRI